MLKWIKAKTEWMFKNNKEQVVLNSYCLQRDHKLSKRALEETETYRNYNTSAILRLCYMMLIKTRCCGAY